MNSSLGKVYLIGAGPGDIELLTLKAVRCIGESDVILLDSLASDDVLQFAKPEATLIRVGKRCGQHSVSQHEIESRLISLAQQGLTVSRVKGGDATLFARGGEELDALNANGIPCEIVSGITAASGITASLKIPLTHRDLSRQLIFLVGPQFENDDPGRFLPPLASYVGTIVVYMGLKSCATVCQKLIEGGLSGDTPAVAVQAGTLPEEKTAFAPLATLAAAVLKEKLSSPVLLIVGAVVALSPNYQATVSLCLSGSGGAL